MAGELTENGSLKLWVCMPEVVEASALLTPQPSSFLEADPCPSHSCEVTASRHLGLSGSSLLGAQ